MRLRRFRVVGCFVLVVMLLLSGRGFAQGSTTNEVRIQAEHLREALLQRDSFSLKKLLHDKLSYGHSNGWIESKREVIEDLYNGKLVYNKIDQDAPQIVVEGNSAVLRTNMELAATLNGNVVQLKLSVLQVWIKKGKDWQLLGRQSVKL